eukprot:CAMPEP_0115833358 /NCGR_PEP_ID=MMETSP0287-20121206/3133_1 /TAXON_ID=412157 /ORGANISM="Chrysochromulina rotalis, Strain UIO044" /LENGTH=136 /DNA_ID=CAMNT_0003286773 /DNA_START=280 /DNA_END=690 /DNA_ORIENTATION=-
MGVAYRNMFRAVRWLVSGIGDDSVLPDIDPRTSVLPPPRAPSVLVPLPESTSVSSVEIIVKVLLPTAEFGQGMVYNERRTLQAFINFEDAPGIATLARLIASEGGDGGIKAYFKARREAGHLRIYVDRVLPQPAHW